ncbi:glycosyltransferase involved in cell wall biosynthesis [Paenarthrobacter nicotinovorans]|uniref:glycosyltransferase family 2 protein n=1 Tax=Paenarthrobacter nicotinovorans TaxID=29320 RepID=UPI002786CAF0|nr:glycosyltransferase family 2 protein [Paenarthrobacter nicotinovorans]MDP9936241.1 glycosyltransferase involved in cell wall biosynthesis [Paenarthrobacter nicotinovorans]
MTHGARVTIVTRTKNRPVFLARALDDIFGQTFQDFELVIVNDGGDPSDVDRLTSQRPEIERERITTLHHSESVGMEGASNAGVKAGTGEFVVIHDDDDFWAPDFLARTVAYLDDSAHADETGVMVRTEIVIEELVGDRIEPVRREIFWAGMRQITLSDMLKINRAVPISFLYRRSVHEAVGFYNEDLPVVGDWEFHLRVLSHSRVGFLDGEPLAFWSQRPESEGHDGNSIFAKAAEHAHYDALVRDEHLRDDVARNGLGTVLYLTRVLAEQEELIVAQQRRLDDTTAKLDHILDRIEALNHTVVTRTSVREFLKKPMLLARKLGLRS